MDLNELIKAIKAHPDFDNVGMILSHTGVVRSTSRTGRTVTGLTVSVNHEKLRQVIKTQKSGTGIVEILVQIAENQYLSVGDDVMLLLVAGDIRENVIPVLYDTLNAIKTTVTEKTEFFSY